MEQGWHRDDAVEFSPVIRFFSGSFSFPPSVKTHISNSNRPVNCEQGKPLGCSSLNCHLFEMLGKKCRQINASNFLCYDNKNDDSVVQFSGKRLTYMSQIMDIILLDKIKGLTFNILHYLSAIKR